VANLQELELRKLSFDEHPWPDIPHLILKPTDTSARGCIAALLEATQDLEQLFATHPGIDEEEPWFGWAFERDGATISEAALLDEAVADPGLRPLIDTYVERVIAHFVATDAEPGFYVHEEKEAGSDAICKLVLAEPHTYFDRYLQFLKAVDLEHTVAQHDNVRMMSKVLSDEQRARLRSLLADTTGGEYFGDF